MVDKDKIRVDLCCDHFQRLLKNDVCSNCPSIPENETVVLAMSRVIQADQKDSMRAVVSELQSIRRVQSQFYKDLDKISDCIYGNGVKGVRQRLVVLETKFEDMMKNNTKLFALLGLIVTIVNLIISQKK